MCKLKKYLKNFLKGGEEKMKRLNVILLVVMILAAPVIAKAGPISLHFNAPVQGGTDPGEWDLIECNGRTYNTAGDPFTQPACKPAVKKGTQLNFKGGKDNENAYLDHAIYDPTTGNLMGGSDCFYATNFFIVYLYPDAWGGKGYELKQKATISDADIAKALVFTPVYSAKDKYKQPKAGGKPGETELVEQGELDLKGQEGDNNPQLKEGAKPFLATSEALILKAKRGRVVRAQYGIPPKPDTVRNSASDARPDSWQAIPLTKTPATYSGDITISLTEWQ